LPAVIQELGSVGNGIAQTIERKRSEEALDASEVKYRSRTRQNSTIIVQGQLRVHLHPAHLAVIGSKAGFVAAIVQLAARSIAKTNMAVALPGHRDDIFKNRVPSRVFELLNPVISFHAGSADRPMAKLVDLKYHLCSFPPRSDISLTRRPAPLRILRSMVCRDPVAH